MNAGSHAEADETTSRPADGLKGLIATLKQAKYQRHRSLELDQNETDSDRVILRIMFPNGRKDSRVTITLKKETTVFNLQNMFRHTHVIFSCK